MKIRVGNNRIAWKLTAGYMLLTFISFTLLGLLYTSYFRAVAFENKTANLKQRADQIADQTRNYLAGRLDVRQYADYCRITRDIVGGQVYVADRNMRGLFQETLDPKQSYTGAGGDAEQAALLQALRGQQTADILLEENSRKPYVLIGMPVRDDNRRIVGAVLLYTPASGVMESINESVRVFMLAALAVVLLTGGLGYYYARRFTRPMRTMRQAALDMARGSYDVRLRIDQQDEIGELGDALDLLASRLGYTLDQLHQEQTRLEDVIASIQEGILAFDRDLRLIRYNEAAQGLIPGASNRAFEDDVRRTLTDKGLDADFRQVMETGTVLEKQVQWDDRIIRMILSPVTDRSRQIVGVVGLLQDISEAQRLENMRREFIANVSHELRTPLTLLRGSAEALLDGVVTSEEDVARYCRRILDETRGLERLVNDLFDLTRLQSGRMTLHWEAVDIAALASDLSRGMQDAAAAKKISLKAELGSGIPPVTGDYDRLRQVLLIFIDNAMKHCEEGASVTIRVLAAEMVTIQVQDNGPGIAAGDLPHIWERFYKGNKSRSESDSGAGLGLAIARSLIELHNGSVRIDSLVGRGTTVTIELHGEKTPQTEG